MAQAFHSIGIREGTEIQLPQDLDALIIETHTGEICLDLARPDDGVILARRVPNDMRQDCGAGLFLSPLPSGRLALEVIQG
jgi:hypothetical protein